MDKEILEILKEFRLEFKSIKEEFKAVNTKLDENTQILRALEHSAQVNKAEHDKISNDIAHINGNIESLRSDVSTVEKVTANNYAYIAGLKSVK